MTTYTTYQERKAMKEVIMSQYGHEPQGLGTISNKFVLLAGVAHADLIERERFTKLNMLFAAFLTITFTLANLPLSVLDYMALTTP